MDGMRFDCPHCGRMLFAPPAAFGERLRCPECRWQIIVPHPAVSPPSQIVLDRQTDIITDYHGRLIELYESTTVLIETAKGKGAAIEVEVNEILDREQTRVSSLIEAARRQLAGIVDDAERAARVKFVQRFPNKIRCPHCQKKVRYKDRGAGRGFQCPNPDCRQRIVLPEVFEPFSTSDFQSK
jgi:tRNA(Ile2) C34 agmatinyltransferase TiaS